MLKGKGDMAVPPQKQREAGGAAGFEHGAKEGRRP